MSDLTQMRQSYQKGELRRGDLSARPLELFSRWLSEALQGEVPEPYALSLATASASGRPSVRTVLLRGYEARGLSFYTNYDSRKGRDLAENPQAELLFFWPDLERQVRVYGAVERLSATESAEYFHKRPHASQLAAHASDPQSAPIENREVLESKFTDLQARYAQGAAIPKPDFWGGYLLRPAQWEFWQGRRNRMHDRFLYTREPSGESWRAQRLMP